MFEEWQVVASERRPGRAFPEDLCVEVCRCRLDWQEWCKICTLSVISTIDPSVGVLLHIGCLDFENL